MISDTLSEAVTTIRDHYLSGPPIYAEIYGQPGDPLRDEIESVLGHMDRLRRKLDRVPDGLSVPSP